MKRAASRTSSIRYGILVRSLTVLAMLLLPLMAGARQTLHGAIIDAETKQPVAYVTVILDRAAVRISADDGSFDFGAVTAGSHVLTFDHISFKRRVIKIDWPSGAVPLVVELEPAQYMVEEIVVEGERIPFGSTAISRRDVSMAAGNVASDPLRTVQSNPSCATDGVDFLSKTAVRGGDTEEHRVYFDGYPLAHYTHVGGFTGVIYDDMLGGTVLIPGAAPIRYKGNLSGTVLLEPVDADTSFLSFRYDITSMAGGLSRAAGSSLSVQASAKTSFFNLPVYQQVGVKERSFRDLLGRVILIPGDKLALTATLLAAMESETGSAFGGVQPERDAGSVLAGIRLSYMTSRWEMTLRPSYSYYDSRDALSWWLQDRDHRLHDVRLYGEATVRGGVLDLAFSGEIGQVRHAGSGGEWSDNLFSTSAGITLKQANLASLELAIGGSKEPWTSRFEPEAYGALLMHLGARVEFSAGYRRSHQSPFRFSERRYFASLPIDAGDLLAAYAPSWEEALAVRMDQVAAGLTCRLPFRCSVACNAFWRWYRNLLTWEWRDFPDPVDVGSGGEGHGHGYEIVFERNDPGFVSVMAAAARARVWKREGTLGEERVGDFDRPNSWQIGLGAALTDNARLSIRLADVDGRPYTPYQYRSEAPATGEVNAVRLPRYRRLDIKFVYGYHHRSFEVEFFVDVVNVLNRENIVMMYALEINPGEFISLPYGGTAPFPIGGVTIRW